MAKNVLLVLESYGFLMGTFNAHGHSIQDICVASGWSSPLLDLIIYNLIIYKMSSLALHVLSVLEESNLAKSVVQHSS